MAGAFWPASAQNLCVCFGPEELGQAVRRDGFTQLIAHLKALIFKPLSGFLHLCLVHPSSPLFIYHQGFQVICFTAEKAGAVTG